MSFSLNRRTFLLATAAVSVSLPFTSWAGVRLDTESARSRLSQLEGALGAASVSLPSIPLMDARWGIGTENGFR
jgi:hypothetical protein